MPSSDTWDAVVVGGGHNGLVAATRLARAGRRVLVLEAAEATGGAARTIEFLSGWRVPAVAHFAHLLHPAILRELDLARHGLRWAASNVATTVLDPDGRALRLAGPFGERIEGSVGGAEGWPALRARLLRFARTLQPFLTEIPPPLAGGHWRERLPLARLGLAIRRLGRAEGQEFLRMALMSVADALEEELACPKLAGAVAFDAVLGTRLGPRSPTSLMTLLYRLAGSVDGRQAALALPVGGMGSVAAALEAAARAAGVTIRTATPVAAIEVERGRVVAVVTEAGERIAAAVIVSAVNPRTTFLDLVGAPRLDTDFVRRVEGIRIRGTVAKLHLALDGAPAFIGLPPERLGDRLLVAPSIDHVERAFNAVKYGEASPAPAMEIVLPTVTDPSLAPAGGHVLSACIQYVPPGADRAAVLRTAMAVLEAHAPGIGARVRAAELLTPDDLEARWRMPGGQWHHGELAVDQMFVLRPVFGAERYDTPVGGLYLCGAGSHPGGGVSGVPGWNAARRILEREGRR